MHSWSVLFEVSDPGVTDLIPSLLSFEWILNYAIGLISMVLFILSGNRFSRGDYVGGLLSIAAATIVATATTLSQAFAEYSPGSPPAGSMFAFSKISQTMDFLTWAIKGGAGLSAIIFLIMAGNYANRGEYTKALGATVGAVLAGAGAILVSTIQQ